MGVIRENLRRNIVHYLALCKISQKTFAEKLHVSPAAVSNWVKGRNTPDIELVVQMCDIFKIPIAELTSVTRRIPPPCAGVRAPLMTREDIAQVLKRSRIRAGLTQKQAAQAVGRKQQTLASWEAAQSQPSINTLFQLFDVYGLSVDHAFALQKRDSVLSEAALEIAAAYDHADDAIKLAIRKLLDVRPDPSPQQ